MRVGGCLAAAAVLWQWQYGGGSALAVAAGSGGGTMAAAAAWGCRSDGGSLVAAMAAARWRRQQGGSSGGTMAAAAAWWRRSDGGSKAAAACGNGTGGGSSDALAQHGGGVSCLAPTTIESMGTVVLVAQLARHGFVFVVVARRFFLGRGRREDSADVVIDSGARGNVHYGRRGADNAKSNADDYICYMY